MPMCSLRNSLMPGADFPIGLLSRVSSKFSRRCNSKPPSCLTTFGHSRIFPEESPSHLIRVFEPSLVMKQLYSFYITCRGESFLLYSLQTWPSLRDAGKSCRIFRWPRVDALR